MAEDYRSDQIEGPPGEFSWLLRAAVAAFPARSLGRWFDLRLCPVAIRCGRARRARQRTGYVWPGGLPEWLDFFHFGLWRHYSDVDFCSGSGGAGSRHGLRLSGCGYRILADNLFVVFQARNRDLLARRTRRF